MTLNLNGEFSKALLINLEVEPKTPTQDLDLRYVLVILLMVQKSGVHQLIW